MKKIEDLRIMQGLEYNILCFVVDFFDAHDISYILSGGTMLGAVRHNGFIPWDDDIDVRVPRKDYERIKELVKNGTFCSEYFQVLLPGDPGYSYPFIKVVDMRTEAREGLAQTFSRVWIDIFPLDHYPDSKLQHFVVFCGTKFLDLLLTGRIVFGSRNHPLHKQIAATILTAICKLLGGAEKVAKRIDQRAARLDKKYCKSDHCGDGAWPVGMQDYFKTEWIFPSVPQRFENRDFMIPHKFDEYLTQFYGDYMVLPPEEKRQLQHKLQVWWTSKEDIPTPLT